MVHSSPAHGTRDHAAVVQSLEIKHVQCAFAVALEQGFEQVESNAVPLGPADHLVPAFIPIAVTWVYSNAIDNDKLYRACELILDYYPHLTGRLRPRSEDGTCEITSLGRGACFIIAKCKLKLDETFDDFKDVSVARLPGAGNDLMPPFNPSMQDVGENPLFAIQSTSFACGGTVLGIRLPHGVCDGHGYFQFVHNLSKLYRQINSTATSPGLVTRPVIKPYLGDFDKKASKEELRQARAAKPVMFYSTSAEQPTSKTALPVATDPVTGRVLRFSGEQLKLLKTQATGPEDGQWVSTFEAISALLHQSVYKARLLYYGESHLSPPDFLCPLNYRSRMSELSDLYFPNFGITMYTTIPHQTLEEGQLWEVAAALHNLIRNDAPNEEQVETLMKWLAAQPDKRLVRNGFRMGNGSFQISQWTGFSMYKDMDFEEGIEPLLVSPPFTSVSLVDGLAYIMPTEAQGHLVNVGADKESLDVNMALADPLWAILEEDESLSKLCTVSRVA